MLRVGVRLPNKVLSKLLDHVFVLGNEGRRQSLRRRVRLILTHNLGDVV